MINVKDHKSGYLWDPWEHLGSKRKKLIEESWAGIFQNHVLPNLPVDSVIPFYSRNKGRPTKELHTMLGVLILQQMHNLTDNDTIEQFAFNIQWQYALGITSFSDEESYICPKTLWSFRDLVIEKGIDKIIFNDITDHIIETLDIDISAQRLDSVHIQSNMRHLGRIRIIAATIKPFLVNLKRNYPDLLTDVSEEIQKRYKNDNALSVFSLVKPTESHKTLEQVSQDLHSLCQSFKDNDQVKAMSTYGCMLRVLREQCDVNNDDETVAAKPAKKITSDSLQNPSDPDATYDAHKGKGYQAQVMETWSNKEEDKIDTPNIITHIELERAHESDAHALLPAIKNTQEHNHAPKEILADSLYGGDDNVEKAKLENVEVVSPVMGRKSKKDISISDFKFSENGQIIECPEGHKPVEQTKNKTETTVLFEVDVCSKCSQCSQCLVKKRKKYYSLKFDDKDVRLAVRRDHEETVAFKDKYRKRSGVEATMSEFDRRTGVKNLRVRGFNAVRFCVTIKALAINIYRVATSLKTRNKDSQPEHTPQTPFKSLIFNFKELFSPRLSSLVNF